LFALSLTAFAQPGKDRCHVYVIDLVKSKQAVEKFRSTGNLKSEWCANGAEYDSQGQARSASPLVNDTKEISRPEGPKYARYYYALSGLERFDDLLPGATRSAPLCACPWLSYFAPLALSFDFQGKATCRQKFETQ